MPIFRDDSAAWPIRASSTWENWETDSIAGHDSRCLQLAAAAVRLGVALFAERLTGLQV